MVDFATVVKSAVDVEAEVVIFGFTLVNTNSSSSVLNIRSSFLFPAFSERQT